MVVIAGNKGSQNKSLGKICTKIFNKKQLLLTYQISLESNNMKRGKDTRRISIFKMVHFPIEK